MKICIFQTVLSPYRIPLFQRLARVDGVSFGLILLSTSFKVRPQWRRDLSDLGFEVRTPYSWSVQIGEEKEFCINPLLLLTLIRERPDVIICGGYNLATMVAWLYRLLTGRPYVIWTEATKHTDGRIAGARLALRRVLARGAAAFIDAGTLARDYVRFLVPGITEDRLFRAFNCVENTRFATGGRDRAGEGDPRTGPGTERKLLFVGKLNERKGIPALLRAYASVSEAERLPVSLILLGEGPERPMVEDFKRQHGLDRLRLMGWVENAEAAGYYATADVFVLLSRVDHNPLVLFEALAAGTPVVCSNGVCNAVDFIEPGITGYIVDPERHEEVVERLRDVINWSPEKRLACAERARAAVSRANYESAAEGFLGACRFAARGNMKREAR